MDKDKKLNSGKDKMDKKKKPEDNESEKKKGEEIDEELDQTFPASDPPSYSRPGNNEKES